MGCCSGLSPWPEGNCILCGHGPSVQFVQTTLEQLFLSEMTSNHLCVQVLILLLSKKHGWEKYFKISAHPLSQKGTVQSAGIVGGTGEPWLIAFDLGNLFPLSLLCRTLSSLAFYPCPVSKPFGPAEVKFKRRAVAFIFSDVFKGVRNVIPFSVHKWQAKMSVPKGGASSPQLLWRGPNISWYDPGGILLPFGTCHDSAMCGRL